MMPLAGQPPARDGRYNLRGADMERFFNPESVVVIGASNSPFNLGATICRALNEVSAWGGTVFAVNRKAETVHGCQGFKAVTDIPQDVDLAVIITPAKVVPEFVEQCAEKGIRRIVIESSGFAEGGEEGKVMQRRIDEIARKNGIRILGPNCLGVLNARNQFCCFYGIQVDDFSTFAQEDGSISYVIQSGGIVVIVLESFFMDVVKVNKIVSIGNKSDIDEADMLEYFNRDDTTEVIGMYLENIRNGRRFMEAARRVKKPILVFKVGKTGEGARAAVSHTAGMANDDRIFDIACRQAGIIRVDSIADLHSMPRIFTHMPPLKGRRIAVFTNSGAFGGITADLLVQSGLEMARLSPETPAKLARRAASYASTRSTWPPSPAPPIFEFRSLGRGGRPAARAEPLAPHGDRGHCGSGEEVPPLRQARGHLHAQRGVQDHPVPPAVPGAALRIARGGGAGPEGLAPAVPLFPEEGGRPGGYKTGPRRYWQDLRLRVRTCGAGMDEARPLRGDRAGTHEPCAERPAGLREDRPSGAYRVYGAVGLSARGPRMVLRISSLPTMPTSLPSSSTTGMV